MKVTEAINNLAKILGEVGDIDLANFTEIDGMFLIEYNRIFDIIEIPDENEIDFIKLVVYTSPETLEQPHKPNLKLIKE